MKIRAALLASLLALMAVPVAHAQERGQGGERRMQMMFKDITLTAAQKTKVDSILAHYRAEMGPMNQGSRPDSAANRPTSSGDRYTWRLVGFPGRFSTPRAGFDVSLRAFTASSRMPASTE